MKVSSPTSPPEVSETSLVADGHVHIYPNCFDGELAIGDAWDNLRNVCRESPRSNQASRGLFLTERYDCDFFPSLKGARSSAPEVSETSGGWVFGGRQVATRERMEVLALCCRERFEDGLSIGDTLARVRAAGAIPVIPWSPGKWMFRRFAILRDLIFDSQPGDFLLADSSLRPLFYPEPALFGIARARGFGIIAGTDPLPFPGQEKIIGTFGFRLRSGFNPQSPADSVRAALLRPSPDVDIIGRRASPLAVLRRVYKNSRA